MEHNSKGGKKSISASKEGTVMTKRLKIGLVKDSVK